MDERRFSRGSWLALGYALLVSGYGIAISLMMFLVPGDGWELDSDLVMGRLDGDDRVIFQHNLAGAPSPIKAGDELVAIEGLTVAQLADRAYAFYRNRPPSWQDGAVLSYTVLREGQVLDLDVQPHRSSPWLVYLNTARREPARFLIETAGSLFLFAVGVVVFFLRPQERAAQALLILGAGLLPLYFPSATKVAFYPFPLPSTPADPWMAAILPSIAYLVLVFPRPRWPLRRFPRLSVAMLYLSAPLAINLAYLLNLDERAAYVTVATAIYVLGVGSTLALVVFCLIHAALTLRSQVERAQLGWMTLGLLSFLLPGAGVWVAGFVLGVEATQLISAVAWFVMPVCLAIAITRHRLFDIDIIINRTLVYGSLTGTLVLVYFGGVALLQGLFRALTGQTSNLAIVASTLIIAVLFQPLRHWLQAFIDRRFYRRRYDAARTLTAFGATLQDDTDVEPVGARLLGVVQETVQPAHATLWLRTPEERR